MIALVLSRNMTGPIVYEDGLGYFANARYLAGNRAVPSLAPMSFYYPGYSLLIAPLYLLLKTPEAVYQGVLVLNAGLGSLQFLLGYLFLTRFIGWERSVSIWSATAAALYPGVLLLGNYEYSDNLFRVVFVAFAVAAGAFFEKNSVPRGLLLGGVAAFSYWVHPRGLGLVVVTGTLLAVVGGAWKKGRFRSAVPGLSILMVGVFGLQRLNSQLIDAMYRFGDRSTVSYIARLLEPAFWLEVPVRVSGQIWYLTAATAGLFPVGLVVVVVATWRCVPAVRRRGWPSPDEGASLLLLGAATALFGISVIFMTSPDARIPARLDHLIYGRYNDGFVVVFVMLGLGYLLQQSERLRTPRSRLPNWPTLTLVVMMISATILAVAGSEQLASGRPFAPISALGISVYVFEEATIPILLATVASGLLASLVVAVLPRISMHGTAAVLCVAFVGLSFAAEHKVLSRFNEYWMNLLTLHHSVRVVGPPTVMGYDEGMLSLHGLNGYQFWLDRTEFRLFNSTTGDDPPDVDLLIASETWSGAESFGGRLIAVEPRLDQGLWVLPGELQDSLERGGFLLSSDPVRELPVEAMASSIAVERGLRAGDVLRPGEVRSVQVRVRHEGKGSPWVPLGAWAPSPVEGSVRLVARWIPVGGRDVAAVQLAELPRTVLPGEEVLVTMRISPTRDGLSLGSGEYVVRLALVQEGVKAFEDAGDALLDVPVRVGG